MTKFELQQELLSQLKTKGALRNLLTDYSTDDCDKLIERIEAIKVQKIEAERQAAEAAAAKVEKLVALKAKAEELGLSQEDLGELLGGLNQEKTTTKKRREVYEFTFTLDGQEWVVSASMQGKLKSTPDHKAFSEYLKLQKAKDPKFNRKDIPHRLVG